MIVNREFNLKLSNKQYYKSVRLKMSRQNQQCYQISKFLEKYHIISHSPQSTIINSQNKIYLLRTISLINPTPIQQINSTLYQHQSFHLNQLLNLIQFQILNEKQQTKIKAIYQYGQKSLYSEILRRKQENQPFQEQELWVILLELLKALQYLKHKNVIYGVIDTNTVFLDHGVKILDPSCTAIDPYQIIQNRLYSPQLLIQQSQQIDMFQSDVFVLGLLMLQSALLNTQLYQYDQNLIKMCLDQVSQTYSEQFNEVLSRMMLFDPSQRPQFKQLLKSLSDIFEITSQLQFLQPLPQDKQDCLNQISLIQQIRQCEIFDILQDDRIQQDNSFTQMSQYQRARVKFLNLSTFNAVNESSIIDTIDLSRKIQGSFALSSKQSNVKKKLLTGKQIKQKLIKKDQLQNNQNDLKLYNHQRNNTTNYFTQITKNSQQKNIQRLKQKSAKKYSQQKHTIQNIKYISYLENKQNLFTKPEIMNMIKHDMKRIQEKKRKISNHQQNYMPNSSRN